VKNHRICHEITLTSRLSQKTFFPFRKRFCLPFGGKPFKTQGKRTLSARKPFPEHRQHKRVHKKEQSFLHQIDDFLIFTLV